MHLKHKGSCILWKAVLGRSEDNWLARFDWTAEDDMNEKGSPCLDRVNICISMKSKEVI